MHRGTSSLNEETCINMLILATVVIILYILHAIVIYRNAMF